MAKKLKLEHDQSDGYNYFQNLPDELVISIFTKLSSCSDDKYDSLDHLKALGRCLSVSKRFNALACLVPALSIKHLSLVILYKYCPMILKKFKHIRSLRITHWSNTEALMTNQKKDIPIISWEASYRPHSYCLAVVSCKKSSVYIDKDPQSYMLSNATPKDDVYHGSIWSDVKDMFCLHHMLVSSIKDHKYLQRVVVTDVYDRGTLILEEDMLAELRNCSSTNLEHVLVRDRSGSAINLHAPSPMKHMGHVMNKVCFSIIEWREKATHDPIYKDEDVTGIPTDLRRFWPVKLLRILLEDPAYVEVNDSTEILELLSDIKSDGNLI